HYKVMERFNDLIKNDAKLLNKGEAERMSRQIADDNPGVFLRGQIERTIKDETGKDVTYTEGVLPKDVAEGRQDLPSMSAELIGDFTLPGAERLVEARSI